MANWVTAAIETTYREIDREAGGVINYDSNAAEYARKHRKELISEFGEDAIIAVSGDGAGGVYFVSYSDKTADEALSRLGGIGRLEKKGLMLGRVIDVVRAERRFGDYTTELSFEEVRHKALLNPKVKLNLPHGFNYRGYIKWLQKKERKARESA